MNVVCTSLDARAGLLPYTPTVPVWASILFPTATVRGIIRAMALTCPECRHVVEVDEAGVGRCPNCGSAVQPQAVAFSGTASTPAKPAAPPPTAPTPAPEEPSYLAGPQTQVRAASIVALVCGLLFFIPFVTQGLALIFGAFAVFRKRLPKERVAAAWVGIILAVLTLLGWVYAITNLPAIRTWGPAFGPTWNEAGSVDNAWLQPSEWSDTMERVYRATATYHRDYHEWPASIEDLKGRSLPTGFTLPDELRYRPAPADSQSDPQWILMVSAETLFNLEADELHTRHRVILRLSGKIEVLPTDEVEALLAEQPLEESNSQATDETNG